MFTIMVKKFYFAAISFCAMLMASCSSSNSPKMIIPTSTEFTSGELARYISVVDEPCELTFAEKDGLIPTQYIRLKVKLKMQKDGFKDVDARDIDFTSLLSVAIINLVDENDTEVQDLSIKSEELLKFKKLLTGETGDTEEIIFEGEYHNHDDAPKWFADAAKFTPDLTGDISVSNSNANNYEDVACIKEEANDGGMEEAPAGTEDWDAMLDSYDSYVTKYISYIKKAANGDMDALTEYPSLMGKAQEFSEKLQNAQGDMSASQWTRYMKITNKMTEAIANMQ